jgi:hypothetical protein
MHLTREHSSLLRNGKLRHDLNSSIVRLESDLPPAFGTVMRDVGVRTAEVRETKSQDAAEAAADGSCYAIYVVNLGQHMPVLRNVEGGVRADSVWPDASFSTRVCARSWQKGQSIHAGASPRSCRGVTVLPVGAVIFATVSLGWVSIVITLGQVSSPFPL